MTRLLVFVVAALGGSALAAQQLVPTKTLLVRDPPSSARKVLWKVSQPGSTATVMGDPTADGATLRVVLAPGGDQCVTMPSTGWTAIGTIGFKYRDSTLANGPVKVAQIMKTPSGTFQVRALLKNGGPTPIAVVPGNQTSSYATNFTLGVGDAYCGGTATAVPNPNDATTFKVSNDGAPAGCVTACSVTTTTSTTLPSCSGGDPFPACNGTCPPGSVCSTQDLATCVCIDGAQPCGDTGPACNGQCPMGEACFATGGFPLTGCDCLPTGSTACSQFQCGGTCPVGEECNYFERSTPGGTGCVCGPPGPCDGSGGDDCPPGQHCAFGPFPPNFYFCVPS